MILLIARKDYDHQYGLYSKELLHIRMVAEKLKTLNFNLNDHWVIMTSPFESDKESTEYLKEFLSIKEEVGESELLIFGVYAAENSRKLFDAAGHQDIIIVACQAVIMYLLREAERRNFKMTNYGDLYIIN
ncbi:MAG: hypothetical protein US76_02925 [Parcubacteria group bacterium GW2011_GWA2_38_13b]|nr:MAG: hypothetical protein US76_02925 [Parcubacteria group bacterium GW2011_GWA2_38_13b]